MTISKTALIEKKAIDNNSNFSKTYPNTHKKTQERAKTSDLLTTKKLSDLTGEQVTTLRLWVKQGLLKTEMITERRQFFFSSDVIECIKKIQFFKEKNLSHKRIKELLKQPLSFEETKISPTKRLLDRL